MTGRGRGGSGGEGVSAGGGATGAGEGGRGAGTAGAGGGPGRGKDLDLSQWVGREERVEGLLELSHARAVAAMFDDPPEEIALGNPLPPLWHWFYFPAVVRASEVGPDGHPRRGGFLPPVPLPRRMWAGGRVHFHAPLPVGAPAQRHSRILSVEEKEGRSGALVLVTVEHRIVHEGVAAVVEEQDLIYREAPSAAAGGSPAQGSPAQGSPAEGSPAEGSGAGGGEAPRSVPPGWDWQDRTTTDPVLLFRFSALTFNGHRIHYDHPYTTQVEGYPGLVVHGPLSALLLMRSGCAHVGKAPATFRYRGLSPLFCGDPIALVGRQEEPEEAGGAPGTALELRGPQGRPTMEGRISWTTPTSPP
jgi:3-methylfumaryl-CoA hydratase